MTKKKPLPNAAARAWEQNVSRELFPSILHRSSAPCQILHMGGEP